MVSNFHLIVLVIFKDIIKDYFDVRYADQVLVGDEVMVQRLDQLNKEIIIDVFTSTMHGKPYPYYLLFIFQNIFIL